MYRNVDKSLYSDTYGSHSMNGILKELYWCHCSFGLNNNKLLTGHLITG